MKEKIQAKALSSAATQLQQRALQARKDASTGIKLETSKLTTKSVNSVRLDYKKLKKDIEELFEAMNLSENIFPRDLSIDVPEENFGDYHIQDAREFLSRVAQECDKCNSILEEIEREARTPEGGSHVTNEDRFIELNENESFYSDLIEDINNSYMYGIYDGTLVLSRKLIESLLVDILRSEYGESNKTLYFDPDNYQYQRLSKLIDNFDDNLNDFKSYAGGADDSLIADLEDIRSDANDSAHTLETNISAKEIGEYSTKIERTAKKLFRIKSNIP